ncbi:hypothetical protein BCR33DRAFT_854848 [Rhizoclosmatium globosum]|uniref:Homeobox domain-containing protein n=1 Tax=Rhizoclosmatium globosum TaxID=329046 RepID=A0A1Y2BT21_9FUNG|nr:hypothetical protein BCR33DRAFT_854848 [Rhizoclosmatium globosum]|eukprot:ORY37275.1 hypothetical protein BCR33DRAFT_854848 [Rhizoclosmatium globosum]
MSEDGEEFDFDGDEKEVESDFDSNGKKSSKRSQQKKRKVSALETSNVDQNELPFFGRGAANQHKFVEETDGGPPVPLRSDGSRKRVHPTREQLERLEAFFKTNPKPSAAERVEICNAVNINNRSVQIWFQNRRAKARKEAPIEASETAVREPAVKKPKPFSQPTRVNSDVQALLEFATSSVAGPNTANPNNVSPSVPSSKIHATPVSHHTSVAPMSHSQEPPHHPLQQHQDIFYPTDPHSFPPAPTALPQISHSSYAPPEPAPLMDPSFPGPYDPHYSHPPPPPPHQQHAPPSPYFNTPPTRIHATDLTIGSWRRISNPPTTPLLCDISPVQGLMRWSFTEGGYGFRFQVLLMTIVDVSIQHGAGETVVVLDLCSPPQFLRELVDGDGRCTGLFAGCGDFTEGGEAGRWLRWRIGFMGSGGEGERLFGVLERYFEGLRSVGGNSGVPPGSAGELHGAGDVVGQGQHQEYPYPPFEGQGYEAQHQQREPVYQEQNGYHPQADHHQLQQPQHYQSHEEAYNGSQHFQHHAPVTAPNQFSEIPPNNQFEQTQFNEPATVQFGGTEQLFEPSYEQSQQQQNPPQENPEYKADQL